jgi:hypothetical protein
MKTDFYEADAFSGNKGEFLCTIDSDYRWEKGDEVWVETESKRVKVRVTWVHVTVHEDGTVTRELLGLPL